MDSVEKLTMLLYDTLVRKTRDKFHSMYCVGNDKVNENSVFHAGAENAILTVTFGSQDLAVKSRPNLFTHSLTVTCCGLERLLKRGASPNVILPYGATPFHIAVGIGKESYGFHATKLFLQYGGNPNIRSVEGLTPVHVAAMWGKVTTLYLLLVNGGDPWLVDEDGRNAFQHAHTEQQVKALQLLNRRHLQDGNACGSDTEDSQQYSITLDKVILCDRNISLEYVADPAAKLKVPETKSACTQTSYFRSSMTVEGAEGKISSCNKFRAESKVDSFDIQEDSVKSASNKHNDVIVFNDSSKCDNEAFLTELKSVLRRRGETGSMIVPGHFDAGGSNKSKGNAHDALLLSSSSNINVTDKSLEASSKRIREMPDDIISGDCQYFEKDCSVLSYCQDEDSVSLSKEETDSAALQDAKTEGDNCTCESLSKCMTDDLSEGFACENGTKYKSVEDPAYLTSVDMFSSLSIEDDGSVVERKYCLNHTSHLSDLITSDEDGSPVSCPMTCSQLPLVNALEQVPRFSVESCKSLVPLCEEYKYTDDEEGVVLTEKIFLVQHGSMPLVTEERCSNSAPYEEPDVSAASTAASFPVSLDYDSDTLRNDLKKLGQDIGPVTATTKRVYLKKLFALHKHLSLPPPTGNTAREYSQELTQALDNMEVLSSYAALEQSVVQQFSAPDLSCRWREGVSKTSFTYLLLDPRVSCNLPCRSDALSQQERWSTFLAAVFYIGKGRRSRPYAHLYEAVSSWKKPRPHMNRKVRHILDIWSTGLGVVCFHVFQTVIAVEAFTREAAMIDAIGLRNLRNSRRGEYYGEASMWTRSKQQQLGAYLLYRAMQMFLIEGERQVRPDDM